MAKLLANAFGMNVAKVPVVPFGETAMYLPMKNANHSKGKPSKKLGVWLGTIERIEETFIGTF